MGFFLPFVARAAAKSPDSSIVTYWSSHPIGAPVDENGKVPPGEGSLDYGVEVKPANAPDLPSSYRPVFVYGTYEFDRDDYTQVIGGRPVSPESFCSFDAASPVTVKVTMLNGLRSIPAFPVSRYPTHPALDPVAVDTGNVVVRPLTLGLRPKVASDSFTFNVDHFPSQLSIEPGGGSLPRHALQLFINPLDPDPWAIHPPSPSPLQPPATIAPGSTLSLTPRNYHAYLTPGTTTLDLTDPAGPAKNYSSVYFGPGVYTASVILSDHAHIYVSGGAVVNVPFLPPVAGHPMKLANVVNGDRCYLANTLFSNVRKGAVANHTLINGRGILSCRNALEGAWPSGQGGVANTNADGDYNHQPGHPGDWPERSAFFDIAGAHDVTIKDLITIDSGNRGVNVSKVTHALFDNVKCLQYYSRTGSAVVGCSSDVVFRNCYSHNADDGYQIKSWGDHPTDQVTFDHCSIWTQVGISFGLITALGEGPATQPMTHIAYRNCTVFHAGTDNNAKPVIGIYLEGDAGAYASDFDFDHITIEDSGPVKSPALSGPGRITIGVMNNWLLPSLNPKPPHHQPTVLFPLTPKELARAHAGPNDTVYPGRIDRVTFRDVRVLHAADDEVMITAASPAAPIAAVTLQNCEINGDPLRSAHDQRIVAYQQIDRTLSQVTPLPPGALKVEFSGK